MFLEGMEECGERSFILKFAQIRRIRGANIDDEIVNPGEEGIEAGQVVGGSLIVGGRFIFADIPSQDQSLWSGYPAEALGEGFCSLIIEAHSVDEGFISGKAEHAGQGVSRLWLGGDSAEFDESKAQGSHFPERGSIFVETSCEADGVRKLQAHNVALQTGMAQVKKLM